MGNQDISRLERPIRTQRWRKNPDIVVAYPILMRENNGSADILEKGKSKINGSLQVLLRIYQALQRAIMVLVYQTFDSSILGGEGIDYSGDVWVSGKQR